MRARKRFGQHFLHHKAILERIADALAPAPGDLVLEIGPGQGALTEVLAGRGARLTAIEKDRDLAPMVQQRVPQARVVVGDALELAWRDAAGAAPDELLLVTGNIPYNITSPLLAKALEPPRPARIVFLVQEEVADRLAADPGTKEYGALSVGIQAVARVEKLFRVPAGAFHPKPKVHSALIRLTPRPSPLIPGFPDSLLPGFPDSLLPAYRRLVVGLFSYRRKQLTRALREFTGWSAERVGQVLADAGLDAAARPETLSPEAFVRLLRVLIDAGWTRG